MTLCADAMHISLLMPNVLFARSSAVTLLLRRRPTTLMSPVRLSPSVSVFHAALLVRVPSMQTGVNSICTHADERRHVSRAWTSADVDTLKFANVVRCTLRANDRTVSCVLVASAAHDHFLCSGDSSVSKRGNKEK